MKKIRFYLLLTVISACYYLVYFQGYGVRLNRSESLPEQFYLTKSFTFPDYDKIIGFSHPQHSGTIAKVIKGLPGDPIEIKSDRIVVKGQSLGPIQQVSPSGQFMHVIKQTEVPPGSVFVFAPHPDSFDSRYEEFGLVPIESIREELWALY